MAKACAKPSGFDTSKRNEDYLDPIKQKCLGVSVQAGSMRHTWKPYVATTFSSELPFLSLSPS